jgi:phosphatidylglycerol:prolipoprotein diacylglycerol transferase
LLYAVTRLSDFGFDLTDNRLWRGKVFLGGVLVGVPFVIWFTRRFRMSFWRAADVLLPGVALAHVFGRFGCFCGGCCYGAPTSSCLGLCFLNKKMPRGLRDVPLHPTQLYESAGLLLLFVLLLWVWRRKSFDGQVLFAYFLAYPVLRCVVEMFRGDAVRGFVVGPVSTSQFICGILFLVAVSALPLRLRQVRRGAVPAGTLIGAAPSVSQGRTAA